VLPCRFNLELVVQCRCGAGAEAFFNIVPTQAMKLMREGDKWELYVPAELGYGGRGSPSGSIKPGDALVFKIEIVRVNP